jgi:hypothetical protein
MYIMIIPPIEVYAKSNKDKVKLAIESYLQSECIKEIYEEETKYYVNFKSVPTTINIETCLVQLMQGVTFTHNNITYKAFTHYI